MQVGEGLIATGTTFFELPHGDLVVRGTGTIQPTIPAAGSPVLNGVPVTHIAGIYPQENENNVLSGSGLYENASGTFALFGALDLSTVNEGYNVFNCVFFINLQLNK